MIVDDPETKAEVEAAFAAYETALTTNDVAALDGFFHRRADRRSATAAAKTSTAIAAIKAFRAARSPAGLARRLERTQITTYGRDLADRRHAVSPRFGARQDRAADADLGALSRRLAHCRRACQHHRRAEGGR